MKKLFLAILIAVLAMQMTAAVAASDLPGYSSHVLSDSELDAFFADGDAAINAVYTLLENKDETVFGMNFTATDAVLNPDYKDWIVDFVLTSNKDTYVAAFGNYANYGTLLGGMGELKAGEPYRIMKDGANVELWYSFIYNYVKSFNCAAVPVTDELKTAWAAAGGDEADLSDIYSADSDTWLTLSLRIYNPDNENEFYTLSSDSFVYDPTAPEAPMPETGDEAPLVLWISLLALSFVGLTAMRRRNAC